MPEPRRDWGTPPGAESRQPTAAGTVTRLGVAAVLLFAASMKVFSLADPATALLNEGVLSSRLAIATIAAIEAAVGLWMVSGRTSALSWVAATMVFSVFLVVALQMAIAGEADCGCFGPIRVSPWWTALLDAAALASLLSTRRGTRIPKEGFSARSVGQGLVVFLVCLIVAVVPIAAVTYSASRELSPHPGIHDYEGLTLVNPDEWTKGMAFQLAEHIDIGDQLTQGEWTVLFVHHGCPECLELLDRTSRGELAVAGGLAVVEVPPFGQLPHLNKCLTGRLTNDRDWFVPTPLRLTLEDGRVATIERKRD